MGLTRAVCESVALVRCAPFMQKALMNSTTQDGTNPDLNDPIASALEGLGLFPANRANVADGDLAQVLQTMGPMLLDLMEIRVIETCLTRVISQPSSQAWEDYKVDRKTWIKDTQALLTWKWEQYRAKYSGNSSPAVGRMCPATQHTLPTWGYFKRPGLYE